MRLRLKNILKYLNINGRDTVVFSLSLLLAFSIWLIHNLSQNYIEVVRVKVTAKSDIPGHSLMSVNAAPVAARCRIRGFDLIRLNRAASRKPIVVEFKPEDLHRLSDDKFVIKSSELDPYVQSIFGKDASLESIVSDTVLFRFPVENSKKVPVVPVFNVTYKSQYTNDGGLRVAPDSVLLYGEPYRLDQLDKVHTESFSLNSVDKSAHGEIKLDKIKGVRMSQDVVDYSLDVTRYVEISMRVPVTARNVPSDRSLIIYPSTAYVSFRCAFPLVADPTESAKFHIDYKDFEKSLKGDCIPQINRLPQGVLSYTIEPEVFDCAERLK